MSGVTIKGIKYVKKRLENSVRPSAVERVMRKAGEKIRAEVIKKQASVVYGSPKSPNYKRTGNLKTALTTIMNKDGSVTVGYPVGADSRRVPVSEYSGYVEYGTKNMKERPAFRPTLKKMEKELPEFVSKLIWKEIKKAL